MAINLIKSRRGEILGIQFPAALALISVYAFLNHQAAEGSPTLFFLVLIRKWKAFVSGKALFPELPLFVIFYSGAN